MKIQVTQEDIDEGERRSCTKCPIAIALQRATGGLLAAASAKRASARIKGEGWRGGPLPETARDFVIAFDADGEVYPFEFEIDLA